MSNLNQLANAMVIVSLIILLLISAIPGTIVGLIFYYATAYGFIIPFSVTTLIAFVFLVISGRNRRNYRK